MKRRGEETAREMDTTGALGRGGTEMGGDWKKREEEKEESEEVGKGSGGGRTLVQRRRHRQTEGEGNWAGQ